MVFASFLSSLVGQFENGGDKIQLVNSSVSAINDNRS